MIKDEVLKTFTGKNVLVTGGTGLIGRQIVDRFNNKIINVHPALLPAFGGKGMYGHYVHEAVFNRGVKLSGATVHLVNNEYDAGPIVLQKSVSIEQAKNPEEISESCNILIENKSLRTKLSCNANKDVVEKHSLDIAITKTENIYRMSI